jgi:hypothetical protein
MPEIKDKEWVKEHLKDLEQDIEDSQEQLDRAFVELADAQKWVEKMKLQYAEDIIRLANFKKEQKILS